MKISLVCVVLLGAVALSQGEKLRFDGHQVLRFVPRTRSHLDLLGNMYLNNEQRLDFWTEPSNLGESVDIRVSPQQKAWLVGTTRAASLDHMVIIEDVQEKIDAQTVAPRGSKMTWTAYYELEDILAWVDEMAAAYPDIVTTQVIGQSTLGEEVRLMRINKPSSVEKTTIFLNSNIHAREWITSATTTWIFNEILTSGKYEEILDNYDIHYVPVLNPDGYKYTFSDDRLWRKTLSDHDSFWGCLGVDPNRNWDSNFGGPGTSSDKCSEIYHGPSAFSEPEIKAVSEYIAANKDAIKAYVDVHSYSQLILLPWGYTTVKPDDYDELLRVGQLLETGIENLYGTDYEVGTVPDLLYLASGGSFDWVKEALGVQYSIGVELRDQGWNGFVLPPDQIIPSGEETLEGLFAFFDAVRAQTLAK